MNSRYFVIREGEIIGVAEGEEEAQELVDKDYEESEELVKDAYGVDEDTHSPEEIAFMIGHDYGCAYYEEIDVDEVEEDGDYTTSEGDTFSKSELEEWL